MDDDDDDGRDDGFRDWLQTRPFEKASDSEIGGLICDVGHSIYHDAPASALDHELLYSIARELIELRESIANQPPLIPHTAFKVGDRIRKPNGYRFIGLVRSVFTIGSGQVRYVVQNDDGICHIFNTGNLAYYQEPQ